MLLFLKLEARDIPMGLCIALESNQEALSLMKQPIEKARTKEEDFPLVTQAWVQNGKKCVLLW